MANVTQLALLQGLKRIGDLARANLFGAVAGAVCSILVFVWLGEAGVAPAIVVTSLAFLGSSWWFSRQIPLKSTISASWAQMRVKISHMAGIGLAFMWCAILSTVLDALVRSMIVHRLNLEAVGVYQAALTLTGVFANVVLAAMATDFYPRLISVIHDRELASRTINQQTEIGVLLTLPGLLFISSFAPFVVKIAYSSQFLPAAHLLQWMAVGVFARVISWPLNYIQLAKGASRWFAATHTIFVGMQAGLAVWMLGTYGISGVAYAFTGAYVLNVLVLLCVARIHAGFVWSAEALKLILLSLVLLVGAIVMNMATHGPISIVGGILLTLASVVLSCRGLVQRLHHDNRLIRLLMKVPFSHLLWPKHIAGTK